MEKNEQKKVLFFRKGKSHYYKYKENISEVDSWTINLLKNDLILPYKVEFVGYSQAEIGKVISDLYDMGVDIKGEKVDDRQRHALHFIVTFSEKKNIIDAFKIPYISNFYGRTNNINPYTIVDLNGKRVLLEVTKDYAKKNEGNYYFLADDLTDQERTFFDNCYIKLEYDLLYKLQRYDELLQISSAKVFKRTKKRH